MIKIPRNCAILVSLVYIQDTEVQLLNRAPFGGPLHILVGKPPLQLTQVLGIELADQIIVTLPQAEESS